MRRLGYGLVVTFYLLAVLKEITGKITTNPEFSEVNYKFDLAAGQLTNSSGTMQIEPSRYVVDNKKNYIEYSLLEDWLPIKINWDSVYYELKLTAQFKLLSELQAERAEVRKQLESDEQQKVATDNVKEPEEKLFAPGFIEYQGGLETDFSQLGLTEVELGYFGPLAKDITISGGKNPQ